MTSINYHKDYYQNNKQKYRDTGNKYYKNNKNKINEKRRVFSYYIEINGIKYIFNKKSHCKFIKIYTVDIDEEMIRVN